MAEEKNPVGRDQSSSHFDEGLWPFPPDASLARIRSEVCPGLWIFEDAAGQTYLAVVTPGWHPTRGGDLGARW